MWLDFIWHIFIIFYWSKSNLPCLFQHLGVFGHGSMEPRPCRPWLRGRQCSWDARCIPQLVLDHPTRNGPAVESEVLEIEVGESGRVADGTTSRLSWVKMFRGHGFFRHSLACLWMRVDVFLVFLVGQLGLKWSVPQSHCYYCNIFVAFYIHLG